MRPAIVTKYLGPTIHYTAYDVDYYEVRGPGRARIQGAQATLADARRVLRSATSPDVQIACVLTDGSTRWLRDLQEEAEIAAALEQFAADRGRDVCCSK